MRRSGPNPIDKVRQEAAERVAAAERAYRRAPYALVASWLVMAATATVIGWVVTGGGAAELYDIATER